MQISLLNNLKKGLHINISFAPASICGVFFYNKHLAPNSVLHFLFISLIFSYLQEK